MSLHNPVSPRCLRCHMQAVLCVCEHITAVTTTTRVALVMHKMEVYKTSNSGHLALCALTNSEARVRGEREAPLDLSDWFAAPEMHTVVLYPSDDAVPLTQVPRDKPLRLVVPDATWQQARRMVRRTDELRIAQKVLLPPGLVSAYDLRKRKREGGVCTLEAITEALVILEGEHVRAPLQHLLNVFVDRMMWARGKLHKDEVEGGIPRKALHQHGGVSSGYLADAFTKWYAAKNDQRN